jgi:hypothetical protein
MSLRELVAAMPGVPGKSRLEIQAEQEARAKGIASGKKGQELELTLKIEDAERRMKDVLGEKQIPIAKEIAGYKQQLAAIEENKKLSEEMYELNRKAVDLAFEEWEKKDAAEKRLSEERYELDRKAVNLTFDEWEKRDTERKKLEEEGYDLNRKAVQLAFDEWEKGEEKRRADLEKYHDIFVNLNEQRDKQTEENRKHWENMLDTIREGAGRVFDAMLTKGQSVFSSLAKFAEGVLQTMLRSVFQNAVAGLLGGGGRASGGGILGSILGIGGSAATGALGGVVRGGGGAHLQESIVGGATKKGGGFLGSLFGMGGGGAGAVGLGGTLAAGAATAGIATAVALGASFIGGLFQGGANRRAEEQARRAGLIQAQQFAAPEPVTRYGIAGGAGYTVETDLTGSIRGIGVTPTVIVNVENNMIDARHAREAGEVIGQEVSRQLLQGGSLLSDNVAWAAS